MAAEPDRLRDGAPGALGHSFSHAGHQEGVLAIASMGAMGLGTANGNDEYIIDLQPLFDLEHGHVLEVDAICGIHVAALGRYLPFVLAHATPPGLRSP